jgi:hypothetical protein
VPSPGFDSGASDIASGLSVGDFDGDGHVDVVIAYQRTPAGPASVHRGDGRGGFTLAGTPDVPFSSYWTRVRMGDLDGDGLSDLVFRTTRPNEPSRVVARVSRGDGTFALSHVADVGPVVGSSEPRGLDLADVDGDGHLDVVTYHADRISVLLGAGDGSFSAAIESTGGAGEVALGDWNEDGFLDVASAGGNVLLGNGSGGLVLSGFVGGRVAEQIAPADHDGDGHLDLVTLEFGTRVIRWARGDGTGAFERHVVLGDFISPEYTVVDLAVRDLDEDGFLDAVIAVDEPGAALVLRGDGQGGFEAEGHFGLTSGCQGLELLEIADGDGDGHADLLSVMLYPAGAPGSSILFARNRSLDAVDCRAGNVNGGAGPVADVLFVNESAGAGTSRTVTVGIGDPLLIRLDGPPSRPSPLLTSYVLYGSLGEKVLSDVETLPQGVGRICLRTPLTGGVVDVTWNTIGRASLLGPATIASLRAPAVLYDGPAAAPRPLELLLQGILIDPGSPSGLAAVTNAVHLAIQ